MERRRDTDSGFLHDKCCEEGMCQDVGSVCETGLWTWDDNILEVGQGAEQAWAGSSNPGLSLATWIQYLSSLRLSLSAK